MRATAQGILSVAFEHVLEHALGAFVVLDQGDFAGGEVIVSRGDLQLAFFDHRGENRRCLAEQAGLDGRVCFGRADEIRAALIDGGLQVRK